jgi:phage terminase large subunit
MSEWYWHTKADGTRIELTDAFVMTQPDGTPKVLYRTTRKGALYHASIVPNLLAHGPRGTGKSHMMRWDLHMRAMSIPGFSYLMMRRTMPELKKSHLHFIDAEMNLFGTKDASFYHHTDNIAIYPNGSRGYFGHCENEKDIEKYLSSQFCAVCFDEITTFDWDMVIKISASCRVPEGSGLTAFVRGGTNPMGVSADEVHRYYIQKDITPEEDPEFNPDDWGAIQFMPEDNPFLDHKQYRKKFAGLSEAYRKAWLDGEWGVEGAYFTVLPEHLLKNLPMLNGPDGLRPMLEWPWLNIYRTMDWGWHAQDPTVCAWIAVLPNGREIVFKEKMWTYTTAQQVAQEMKETSEGMKVIATFADPTMWDGEKETGHSMASIFEDNGVPLTKSKNNRTAAGYAIQQHLNEKVNEGSEDSKRLVPKMQFYEPTDVRGGCPTVIRTLKMMRVDKNDPGRIADHKQDHYPICAGYFCMADVPATRVPKADRIKPWMKHSTNRRILGVGNVRNPGKSRRYPFES